MVVAFLLSAFTILILALVLDIDLEKTMQSIKNPLLWSAAGLSISMHLGYIGERSQRKIVKKESIKREYIYMIFVFPILLFLVFTNSIPKISLTWNTSNSIIFLFGTFDLLFFIAILIFSTILFFTSCFLIILDVMKFKYQEFPLHGDMIAAIIAYWLMRVSIYGILIKFGVDTDSSDYYLYSTTIIIIIVFTLYSLARKVGTKTELWKYSSFDTHINRFLVWSLRELPRLLKRLGVPSWIDCIVDIDYHASYDLDKRANELEYNNRYGAIKDIYVVDAAFKKFFQDENNRIYGPCGFLMEITVPKSFRYEKRKRVMSCRIFVPRASIGDEPLAKDKSLSWMNLSLNIPEKIEQTMISNGITVMSCAIYDDDSDGINKIAFSLEIYASPNDLLENFIVCLIEPIYRLDREEDMSKWYLYLWSFELIEALESGINEGKEDKDKVDKQYIRDILSVELYDWRSF